MGYRKIKVTINGLVANEADEIIKENNFQNCEVTTNLMEDVYLDYVSLKPGSTTLIAEINESKLVEIFKPKKVKVPQFVAEVLELYETVEGINDFIREYNEDIFGCKFDEWYEENKEIFYRAILDGYEVDKETFYRTTLDGYEVEEKLYTVELDFYTGLFKTLAGNIIVSGTYDIIDVKQKYLTEQEIKDYDDRYWDGGFANEVTE